MMTPSFHSSGLSTTNRNRAFTKAGGGADRLVDQYYTTNVLTSGGGRGGTNEGTRLTAVLVDQ